jgi:hypothetical protein
MNRQLASVVILIAGIFAVVTASAQQRPHDQVMKDIGATFASLKKNLDGNNAAAGVEDAAKLEGLFRETEAFWERLNTKDAVGFAKAAAAAAASVGTAAKGNDTKAAQASYTAIQRNCAGCHSAHREGVANGFVIKP